MVFRSKLIVFDSRKQMNTNTNPQSRTESVPTTDEDLVCKELPPAPTTSSSTPAATRTETTPTKVLVPTDPAVTSASGTGTVTPGPPSTSSGCDAAVAAPAASQANLDRHADSLNLRLRQTLGDEAESVTIHLCSKCKQRLSNRDAATTSSFGERICDACALLSTKRDIGVDVYVDNIAAVAAAATDAVAELPVSVSSSGFGGFVDSSDSCYQSSFAGKEATQAAVTTTPAIIVFPRSTLNSAISSSDPNASPLGSSTEDSETNPLNTFVKSDFTSLDPNIAQALMKLMSENRAEDAARFRKLEEAHAADVDRLEVRINQLETAHSAELSSIQLRLMDSDVSMLFIQLSDILQCFIRHAVSLLEPAVIIPPASVSVLSWIFKRIHPPPSNITRTFFQKLSRDAKRWVTMLQLLQGPRNAVSHPTQLARVVAGPRIQGGALIAPISLRVLLAHYRGAMTSNLFEQLFSHFHPNENVRRFSLRVLLSIYKYSGMIGYQQFVQNDLLAVDVDLIHDRAPPAAGQ